MRGLRCALAAAIAAAAAARADFVSGNIYTTKTAYECGAAPERIYEFNPATQQWRLFAELGGCWINGLTFTPDGKLRASMYAGSAILEFESDGSWKTVLGKADGINWPLGYNNVDYNKQGDFFVLNTGFPNPTIMKFPGGVGPGTVLADVSKGVNGAGPIAVAPDGSVYYNPQIYGPNQSPAAILRYAPDGTMSLFDILTTMGTVGSLAVDSQGTLYASSGKGLFRYKNGDPGEKELITDLFFDPRWAIALSPDESLLYSAAGGLVVELATGKSWSNPTPPPQPLGNGWGWGLAVYVPEPTGCLPLLILVLLLPRGILR